MVARLLRVVLALVLGTLTAGLLVAPPSQAAGDDGVIDILVLGDSYSAGNGATDDQGAAQEYGPADCHRSRVNWSEKYAAALRASGHPVRLVNHACSGGVTADFTSPRVMDTASNRIAAAPAGVTTTTQADASLTASDPCNTRAFPDEEFWTYHATAVVPGVAITYDCTRNLRPQVDFVNSNVDLVLFTMGGNDVGFSSIVQNCFVPVLRTASACKGDVDTARAALPQVQQRLVAGIAAMRAHGLRDDAELVQLGYPWLQQDNGFTLPGLPGSPSYAAGDQVRSLVTDGDAAIAAIAPTVNAGHPGQLTFLQGVPEKFSGHEPDATTPIGNPARWLNQAFEGALVNWYHPNRLGQTAYAELLLTHGTFGAPTGPPATTTQSTRTARLTVRLHPRRAEVGAPVRLRVTVRLSDGTRARGKVSIREVGGRRLATARLHGRGHARVTVRLRDAGPAKLRVVYRDPAVAKVRVTKHLRVTG